MGKPHIDEPAKTSMKTGKAVVGRGSKSCTPYGATCICVQYNKLRVAV